MDNTIHLEDLPKLRAAYKKAVADDREMFSFNNVDILTKFAKYIIEYMEAQQTDAKA